MQFCCISNPSAPFKQDIQAACACVKVHVHMHVTVEMKGSSTCNFKPLH